jgi:spermidine synthase
VSRETPSPENADPEPHSGPQLGSHEGRPALLIDGAVQSVAVPSELEELRGYWPALLPNERPARVLLLGLGGATVVRLLQRRFSPPPAVTGVDDDPRVLALARRVFGLDLPGLVVVEADARRYLRDAAARGKRFDLVIVDLFSDGAVPGFVTSPRFLRSVASVLAPDGVLSVNLSRGRGHRVGLRRLARVFTPERLIATGMNLVVQARPRSARRYRRSET